MSDAPKIVQTMQRIAHLRSALIALLQELDTDHNAKTSWMLTDSAPISTSISASGPKNVKKLAEADLGRASSSDPCDQAAKVLGWQHRLQLVGHLLQLLEAEEAGVLLVQAEEDAPQLQQQPLLQAQLASKAPVAAPGGHVQALADALHERSELLEAQVAAVVDIDLVQEALDLPLLLPAPRLDSEVTQELGDLGDLDHHVPVRVDLVEQLPQVELLEGHLVLPQVPDQREVLAEADSAVAVRVGLAEGGEGDVLPLLVALEEPELEEEHGDDAPGQLPVVLAVSVVGAPEGVVQHHELVRVLLHVLGGEALLLHDVGDARRDDALVVLRGARHELLKPLEVDQAALVRHVLDRRAEEARHLAEAEGVEVRCAQPLQDERALFLVQVPGVVLVTNQELSVERPLPQLPQPLADARHELETEVEEVDAARDGDLLADLQYLLVLHVGLRPEPEAAEALKERLQLELARVIAVVSLERVLELLPHALGYVLELPPPGLPEVLQAHLPAPVPAEVGEAAQALGLRVRVAQVAEDPVVLRRGLGVALVLRTRARGRPPVSARAVRQGVGLPEPHGVRAAGEVVEHHPAESLGRDPERGPRVPVPVQLGRQLHRVRASLLVLRAVALDVCPGALPLHLARHVRGAAAVAGDLQVELAVLGDPLDNLVPHHDGDAVLRCPSEVYHVEARLRMARRLGEKTGLRHPAAVARGVARPKARRLTLLAAWSTCELNSLRVRARISPPPVSSNSRHRRP
eukprot:CAMPEP_0179277718 /NCGR_PEP_ID=MMETSP0797-20121207/35238_1 /TAXON_ID=47934 /ORGANISM="Dinophysis acuminata, Strain DAEP01" /LENGTH=747 /DNA_ID=CAMNT_0020986315 /DNA_START=66 /DNA_END=2306 /DNA_ORIENTATION=-